VQEAIEPGDFHLGEFATQAARFKPRTFTPNTTVRQTDSLMAYLLDPYRLPTPPSGAWHALPRPCAPTSPRPHHCSPSLKGRPASTGVHCTPAADTFVQLAANEVARGGAWVGQTAEAAAPGLPPLPRRPPVRRAAACNTSRACP
jgi:hypothetical protein